MLIAVICCCLVTKSCLSLWDPMDCSTPGFLVLHYLQEFPQTHVHWVGDAIQPSHPLLPASLSALNLSHHQGLFPLSPPPSHPSRSSSLQSLSGSAFEEGGLHGRGGGASWWWWGVGLGGNAKPWVLLQGWDRTKPDCPLEGSQIRATWGLAERKRWTQKSINMTNYFIVVTSQLLSLTENNKQLSIPEKGGVTVLSSVVFQLLTIVTVTV